MSLKGLLTDFKCGVHRTFSISEVGSHLSVFHFFPIPLAAKVDLLVSRIGPEGSTSNSNGPIRDTMKTTVAATGIKEIKKTWCKKNAWTEDGSVDPPPHVKYLSSPFKLLLCSIYPSHPSKFELLCSYRQFTTVYSYTAEIPWSLPTLVSVEKLQNTFAEFLQQFSSFTT